MEPVVQESEGEWSSLSGMYAAEEADFMPQLLGFCPVTKSGFWAGNESMMSTHGGSGLLCSSDVAKNSKFYDFSQGGSNGCSQENYYLEFYIGDVPNTNSYLVEDDDCSVQEISNSNVEESCSQNPPQPEPDLSLRDANSQPEMESELLVREPSENSRKRSHCSGDGQKSKRNVRSKKNQKLASTSNDEESNGAGQNAPGSSSCCSEDDSNGGETSSMSSKGTQALSLSGKTRACRGAATDPQSLYARKRRERINERLRILQSLVPNGTKVDISTMLEEAVHYVKFLQLQINLLSSDDLWMFAPIAYNGMDIGLDLKINNRPR